MSSLRDVHGRRRVAVLGTENSASYSDQPLTDGALASSALAVLHLAVRMRIGAKHGAWVKVLVALLCIVCVLAICIAPDADLPDTVTRATQVAWMLLITIVASAFVVIGLLRLQHYFAGHRLRPLPRSSLQLRPYDSVLELSSIQRC
jgi:hypothetical protein